jgi:dTDP-3-amino-3,4,6-trideoxy-alpha-D-glucose transaminase
LLTGCLPLTDVQPTLPKSVPFIDLARQHALLADELRAAFDRLLGSSAFILGEEVERFEAEFASFCGVEHCVGVASGTAALTVGLQASGIGRGDEVIVPAHTFVASALAVVHAGATPVFCDVELGTGLIDPASANAALSERTAAIMAVHLYGQACDMEGLRSLANAHGLLLVEDAAQAHGARLNGRRSGGLGSFAAFSFYPSKNLGALGDGGAICTDDTAIAEGVRELRNIGQRRKGEHVSLGYNERLDGLQAACLRVKLPHLDGWNARRRAHAGRYGAALGGTLDLLQVRSGAEPVYHVYPARTPSRGELAQVLGNNGIQYGVHYSLAVHQHPMFSELPAESRPLELPIAERWARQELSLPMFAELSEAEVDGVIAACLSARADRG